MSPDAACTPAGGPVRQEGGRAPLAGVRVLDLSALLPGPYATRLLNDLGAEVVKVERPDGDAITEMLPGMYEFLNRGKRVLRVDLKTSEGLSMVYALMAEADVVVEGFRPGVADRLGVGFEAARQMQPTVVYCSISGFGQDGPDRDEPGHDIAYEAAGGAFAGPMAAGATIERPHVPVGDLGSAAFAALTISATLADRNRTEACYLDLSMQEVVAYLAVSRWGTFLQDGNSPTPEELGNYSPGHRVYRTMDERFLALAAVEDRFWSRLCVAIGRPELDADPFDSHRGRMRHREELEVELTLEVGGHRCDLLLERLRAHDVPVAEVADAAGVAASEHLRQRGAVSTVDGQVRLDFPVRIDGHRSWAGDGLARMGEGEGWSVRE
jgi:crotonobetainyl-CoA:carnitine CoA-transferase CaiB-like acyl-CoA transferase